MINPQSQETKGESATKQITYALVVGTVNGGGVRVAGAVQLDAGAVRSFILDVRDARGALVLLLLPLLETSDGLLRKANGRVLELVGILHLADGGLHPLD